MYDREFVIEIFFFNKRSSNVFMFFSSSNYVVFGVILFLMY